jgi:hypothetical protein
MHSVFYGKSGVTGEEAATGGEGEWVAWWGGEGVTGGFEGVRSDDGIQGASR